ncbi:MAG: hypothetical protein R3208_18470 [Ketobacteraceae bacterium]|nr:hypothetical protein [Ketobacteraceae bacterium]
MKTAEWAVTTALRLFWHLLFLANPSSFFLPQSLFFLIIDRQTIAVISGLMGKFLL